MFEVSFSKASRLNYFLLLVSALLRLVHLGWPHTSWLSFIELDKTVVLWSDWLVFCDYGFSVPALWCPLATPTVLSGFLLPWTWGISSRLLQQSAAAAPYLGGGVSSHGRLSWPWMWSNSSWPSCTPQQLLLGTGVAPLGCSPCPQACGSLVMSNSSWPLGLQHARLPCPSPTPRAYSNYSNTKF